ncbi:hypothetical protein BC830DRAFT_69123 [Chytriomyces sp. MP71]|nr:hypothetical protein BC830DRAFT_69123 [Chytriomyces sp. MP71]
MEAYDETKAIAKSIIDPFDFDNNVPNGYDCVMMMLLGFDKILKSDETFTLEALSKRKLQSELNYTHFMNLNYSGALFDPMILDDSGDLLGPFTYESFTGDFLNFSTFALSNTEGTSLNLYNSSVSIFYNGSSIPPPDGSVPLPQMSYTLQTPEGIAILSISTLGLVMGMLAIGYLITFQNEMLYCTLFVLKPCNFRSM